MYPALLLDRDGVVIENRPDYVRSWEDVHIFPEALRALAKIASSRYRIVLVTNQSAVGRGILSLDDATAINRRLISELSRWGVRMDGVYMCPHAPEDACACRKPQPGLILQAADELGLDLPASILIGDAWTDIQAGRAAGVGRLALVLTGRGREQAKLMPPPALQGVPRYESLAQALDDLLRWT